MHCANCGSVQAGTFCSSCGQKRGNIRLPLSEFIADGLSTLTSLDNRVWRTLVPLMTKPGFVTADTLAGRRARYVPPLRMYLIVSFVFFVVLQTFGGVIVFTENDGELTARSDKGIINFGASANQPVAASETATASGPALDDNANAPNPEQSRLGRIFEEIATNPEQAAEALLARLPWAIFLLVPIAAIWLRILFGKHEKFYVPHLVASTHLHTAVLLFLTITQLTELLPGPDVLGALISLGIPVYLLLSFKRIYQTGWFSTVWRVVILGFVHSVALIGALLTSIVLAGLALA